MTTPPVNHNAVGLPIPAAGITRIPGWIQALVAAASIAILGALVLPRPHLPDWSLLAQRSWLVAVHLGSALSALALGSVLLALRKGRRFHRTAGWVWVLLMAACAGSSLFLSGLNGDRWSLIHLLSGWVLIALPLAVAFARRHQVRVHRRMMTGLFLGGLVLAGLFTFVPGRLMWQMFFG